MKDININNRKIAEYLHGKTFPSTYTWDFHKSWDSIMPVVEKMLKDYQSDISFSIEDPNFINRGDDLYYTYILSDCTSKAEANGKTMIEATYNAVVCYIKGLNR